MKKYFKTIQKKLETSKQSTDINYGASTSVSNEYDNDSSSESDNIESDTQTKKRKIPSYAQKYRTEWEKSYTWLKKVGDQAFCSVCYKTLTNNKNHLYRHENQSKTHIKKLSVSDTTNTFYTIEQCVNKSKNVSKTKAKIISEITLVMYCLQNDLPFTLMDSLPDLLQTICSDSSLIKEVKCGKTKAAEMVKQITGPYSKKLIVECLRKNYFSLIIDETTDVSTVKCLVLIARYYDSEKKIIAEKFFGLYELKHSTAEEIFNNIKSALYENEIPLDNLMALASDNASVMTGHLTGVMARFSKLKNNIVYVRCTCHSLHLCASAACQKLPASIEKNVRNIYNFFAHSAKRINEYQEFQEYFNAEKHKILRISSTRWLSYEAVIKRVLEQWEPLQYYFNLLSFEELHSTNANDIKCFLCDLKNKLYLLFLSYILKRINSVNKLFQSAKCQIHLLYQELLELFEDVLKNFIKPGFISAKTDFKDKSMYFSFSLMHCGVDFEEYAASHNFESQELVEVKSDILNFYLELCEQMRKRFDFNDQKLELLKLINPRVIFSGHVPSILPLLNYYPFYKDEKEVLNNQWRRLIGNENLIRIFDENRDVVDFWNIMKNSKNTVNEFFLLELSNYMLTLCALPHSSAAAERQFSTLKLIKTELRNSLKVNTVQMIMFSKELIDKNGKCWKSLQSSEFEELIKFAMDFKFINGKFQKHQ